MNPNECVLCVKILRPFTNVIESRDSKLISVCLINDYSLIANLRIFVYGRGECASISLECIKAKLLILYNFGWKWIIYLWPCLNKSCGHASDLDTILRYIENTNDLQLLCGDRTGQLSTKILSFYNFTITHNPFNILG